MKKRSKWTKWKVGAVGAASMAFLFHEVKASSAFEQAVASAHANITSGSNQFGDSVAPTMDDWTASTRDSFSSDGQQMDQGPDSHNRGRFHDDRQSTSTGQS